MNTADETDIISKYEVSISIEHFQNDRQENAYDEAVEKLVPRTSDMFMSPIKEQAGHDKSSRGCLRVMCAPVPQMKKFTLVGEGMNRHQIC